MNENNAKDARFDIDRYDAAIYTEPFWSGDVVVNESVFPLIGEKGERTFRLMYPAKRIICVKNYTLDRRYAEGADYVLMGDGDLYIPETSAIPMREYLYLHPDQNPENKPTEVFYPHRKVRGDEPERFEFWDESTLLPLQLISVTYEHDADGSIPRPQAIGDRLPRTMAKLRGGESIRILVAGDSLTGGAHASCCQGISPYAPPFAPMSGDALRLMYPSANIELISAGIGGGTSERLIKTGAVEEQITSKSPDLVLIAYGMNDSNDERVGFTDERFCGNILELMRQIRDKLPLCEILLVSSIYSNPLTFDPSRYEAHANVLREIANDRAGQGVAFCDPQGIERFVLRRKAFADIMADNMVHPNDFGMRLIAQTIADSIR